MAFTPRARLLALVASAAAAVGLVCGPPLPPGPCDGPNCACVGGNTCDFECPAVGCVGECAEVNACAAGCGDACTLDCHNNSTCDLACGDQCDARCDEVSSCAVECGAECQVACSKLSSCAVVMVSGEVTCAEVSECDVACALPAGGTTPAEDCGDGVFRCPAGSC